MSRDNGDEAKAEAPELPWALQQKINECLDRTDLTDKMVGELIDGAQTDHDRIVALTVATQAKKARLDARGNVLVDLIDHDEWKLADFAQRKKMQLIQEKLIDCYSVESVDDFMHAQPQAKDVVGPMRRYPLITRETDMPQVYEPGRWRCLSQLLFVDTKSLRYKRKDEPYSKYNSNKSDRPLVPVVLSGDDK